MARTFVSVSGRGPVAPAGIKRERGIGSGSGLPSNRHRDRLQSAAAPATVCGEPICQDHWDAGLRAVLGRCRRDGDDPQARRPAGTVHHLDPSEGRKRRRSCRLPFRRACGRAPPLRLSGLAGPRGGFTPVPSSSAAAPDRAVTADARGARAPGRRPPSHERSGAPSIERPCLAGRAVSPMKGQGRRRLAPGSGRAGSRSEPAARRGGRA